MMRKSHERAADVMFIQEKHIELAAIAWAGYQELGRGFLLISGTAGDYFPSTKNTLDLAGSLVDGTLNAVYVPAKAINLSGADYPTDKTEEIVESYDADWEIVLVIERQDGSGWANYRFVCPLKPELAYQSLKGRLPVM